MSNALIERYHLNHDITSDKLIKRLRNMINRKGVYYTKEYILDNGFSIEGEIRNPYSEYGVVLLTTLNSNELYDALDFFSDLSNVFLLLKKKNANADKIIENLINELFKEDYPYLLEIVTRSLMEIKDIDLIKKAVDIYVKNDDKNKRGFSLEGLDDYAININSKDLTSYLLFRSMDYYTKEEIMKMFSNIIKYNEEDNFFDENGRNSELKRIENIIFNYSMGRYFDKKENVYKDIAIMFVNESIKSNNPYVCYYVYRYLNEFVGIEEKEKINSIINSSGIDELIKKLKSFNLINDRVDKRDIDLSFIKKLGKWF